MFPNPQAALPLPPHPSLQQYKKQAKDLVKACSSADHEAIRGWAVKWLRSLAALQDPSIGDWIVGQADDITQFVRSRLSNGKCSLADAQFVIARVHGFASWPKFAKQIDEPVSDFELAAEAIVEGDAATLKRLLRKNPELIRARSTREHQSTLLHYVSANGVEGYRQKTPKNAAQIAEILLNAGAEVDAEADVYGGGATALGLIATSVHPEAAGVQNALLQILLDHGAAIEHPRSAGNNHKAVVGCLENGRGKAAEFLAEHGAHLDLEGAAGVGRLDIVKTFFDDDGMLKPTAKEKQLKDGFAWACQFGRSSVVDFLLDHGIDVNARLRHHGNTGLHWAAYGGHANTVKLLLQRGAETDARDETYEGTPLEWALHGWASRPEQAQREPYYEVVALLTRADAKLDQAWVETSRQEIAQKIKSDSRMREALRRER